MTVPETSILDWLIARYPTAKKQTLRRMIQAGRVRVDGRRARTSRDPIGAGAKVEVIGKQVSQLAVQPRGKGLPLAIVYEDADILVVNKPPGLLTSTTPREPRATLLEQVRRYVSDTDPRARVGLIHRLDRDASGLLIFSKNDAAYRSLKTQFFKHTVTRRYAAVVHGIPTPERGHIRTRLVERADGTVRSTDDARAGQVAITVYETQKSRKRMSLLHVTLQTGRKHQIRVHLSEREMPVVGDSLYGRKKDDAPRLMLAAILLKVAHPRTGKPMKFEQPIPGEFPLLPDDK